jgi:uncharacterized membrane protein YhhN
MRNIPAFFFAVACLLNWAGHIWAPAMCNAVKPALMPLLALSVVVYALNHRVDKRKLTLLVCAQIFGCIGDTLLIFDEFPLFAGGIGAFLIGHLYYIALFGRESWKKLGGMAWGFGLVVMLGLVFGLVKLLRIQGELLIPMAVYGFTLALLMFSTFCGLVRATRKGTWFILFVGSVLFTFSDSLIAAGTFGVWQFPHQGLAIMVTYLIAQSMLAWGSVRLAKS